MEEAVSRVELRTKQGHLMRPRELFDCLQRHCTLPPLKFRKLVEGQAGIARNQGNWTWLDGARKDATFFFDDAWINQHLPRRSGVSFRSRVIPPQPEYGGSQMCKDIRYLPNVSVNVGQKIGSHTELSAPVPCKEPKISLEESAVVSEQATSVPEIPGPSNPPTLKKKTRGRKRSRKSIRAAGTKKSMGLVSSGLGSTIPQAVERIEPEASTVTAQGELGVTLVSSGLVSMIPKAVEGINAELRVTLDTKGIRRVDGQPLGQQPAPESTPVQPVTVKKKEGSSLCPACGRSLRCLRRHVLSKHLPSLLNDGESDAQLMSPEFHGLRFDCISELAQLVCGPGSGLREALHFLNKHRTLSTQSEITDRTQEAMRKLAEAQGLLIPAQFKLRPLNSVACLIHWRPLVSLLSSLSAMDRRQFKANWEDRARVVSGLGSVASSSLCSRSLSERVGEGIGSQGPRTGVSLEEMRAGVSPDGTGEGPLPIPPTMTSTPSDNITDCGELLEAIDTHFHLDRTAMKVLHNPKLSKFRSYRSDDLLRIVMEYKSPVQPLIPVKLVGMVAVYCDPETYPCEPPRDPRVKITVGVHPKKAGAFTEEHFLSLRRALASPEAVGMGEIGLDWTMPVSTWKRQEEVFCKVLRFACPGQVLVLHLRSKTSSDCSAYRRGLELVEAACGRYQPVHLHCFTGDSGVVATWTYTFPNCHFGFTAAVAGFNESQTGALRTIRPSRLLLETDSPYLSPVTRAGNNAGRALINTPIFIGDVAQMIATARGVPVSDILGWTRENGRRLYSL